MQISTEGTRFEVANIWGRTLAVAAVGVVATCGAIVAPQRLQQRHATEKVENEVARIGKTISEQAQAQQRRLEAVAAQTTEIPLGMEPNEVLPPIQRATPPSDGLFRFVWLVGPVFGEADAEIGIANRYRMFGLVGQQTRFASDGVSAGKTILEDLNDIGLSVLPGPTAKPKLVRIDPDKMGTNSLPQAAPSDVNVAKQQTWAIAVPIPKVGWALSPIEPKGMTDLFERIPDRDVLDVSLHDGSSMAAPALAQIRPTNPPKPEDARWTSGVLDMAGTQLTTIIGHDKNYGASTALDSVAVGALGGALTTLASGIVFVRLHRRNRRVLEAALRDARAIARTDELTRLGNRLSINEALRDHPDTAPLAVLLCDLDRFKMINDARGHDAGDNVLREVAARITDACRGAECEDVEVARFGGDEFVVILRGEDAGRALAVAESIVAKLTRPFTIGSDAVVIGVSVGLAQSADIAEGSTHSTLLHDADAAMYLAKRNGGNRVGVAGVDTNTNGVHQLDTEIALRAALGTEQIQAWFQPIVDDREDICALEALVRWKHPERGLVSPGQFLPAAKDAGLLAEISTIVLAQSCFAVADWNTQRVASGLAPLLVHVNCVEEQLTDSGFADVVNAYVRASGIDPNCLLLEISEETAFERLPATLPTLDLIRKQGVRFSLDDFGFGNSSLTMVRRLGNIAELKIDKSIVDSLAPRTGTDRGTATDLAADTAVIRAVTDFAQAQGIAVVAEGIEHHSQFEQLRAFGVDMFQGFHFFRPQPPDAIRELVLRDTRRVTVMSPQLVLQ